MVGIGEAAVERFNLFHLNIGRNYHPVDYVILGVCRIRGIVRLVEQAAGGCGGIKGEGESIRNAVFLKDAGRPVLRMRVGIDFFRIGEKLIEISRGQNVIPLLILTLHKFTQLLRLGNLALPAVVCLEVEVDEHQLFLALLYRQIRYQQAAFEI